MRSILVGLLVVVASSGCTAGTGPEEGDACSAAVERVAACHGDDAAAAFAEDCNADTAAMAMDDTCATDLGKADGFGSGVHPDGEEHFKYGTIGADIMGMPEPIWRALPVVCEDLWRDYAALPSSADPLDEPYSAFGMIYEPGHDTPIGLSSRRVLGIELVGANCSTCHTTTVRESVDAEPQLYFGAPAASFDLEAYNSFMLACVESSSFSKYSLNAAFKRMGERHYLLSFMTYFLDAFVADSRRKFHAIHRDGPWGPGRDDAIGLSAAFLLGDELIPDIPAPVDFPSSWNQDERVGGLLHWDGAAGSAEERNVLVSVGAGTPKNKVPFYSLDAIQGWLEDLEPPAYPYAIDETLLPRGQELFDELCASCHFDSGERFGEVVPLDEVGTDPNRVLVTTEEGVAALNDLSGAGWSFGGFRKTDGYVNALLDGIWLRAPYLHNGSVPTLRDLLSPASERPTSFYRGYNVYDQQNAGYVSTVPVRDHDASYGVFDTTRSGNGNGGHEYGTDLPESDKDALIEYLKTL